MLGNRAVVVTCFMLLSGFAKPSYTMRVYESPDASATTEGDVVLATDPDTAFRTAIDYQRWPQIFPNVRQAIVTNHHGDDTEVMFVHADGSREQLHFVAKPKARTVWFEQIGGNATVTAEIAFAPGDKPHTTLVHSKLHAAAQGIAAAFVGQDQLRDLRQSWLREDLTKLRAFFAKH